MHALPADQPFCGCSFIFFCNMFQSKNALSKAEDAPSARTNIPATTCLQHHAYLASARSKELIKLYDLIFLP